MGEAGLELMVANLVVARRTLRAGPAAADKGQSHAVAGSPAADRPPHRLDDSGELVAGYVRRRDIGIVALPAVPVAATQAGGFDLNHHTSVGWRRIGQGLDGGRLGEFFVKDSFHILPLLVFLRFAQPLLFNGRAVTIFANKFGCAGNHIHFIAMFFGLLFRYIT